MLVSMVIPFHNEEDNVSHVIDKLNKVLTSYKIKSEIIAVDDRSEDATVKLLDKLERKLTNLKVIHRKGKVDDVEIGYAIRDAIKIAKGEFVVVMMGDLSDNPTDVIKVIRKMEEGYDIVCASRFIKGSMLVNYPPLKYIMTRIYNILFSFLFGLNVKDFSNAFKGYRRDIFKKIKIESKEFEVTAEVLLKARLLDYRIAEVPVKWYNRKSGESKLGSFSFSPSFLFKKLPRIGWRYGTLALKLYVSYLSKVLTGKAIF